MAVKDFIPVYVGDKEGDEGIVRSFPEAAGETFKNGDLLTLDAAGRCVGGTVAVGANLTGVTNTVLGFAKADASGVTDRMVPIQMIRPSDIFRIAYDPAQTFVIGDVKVAAVEIKRFAAGRWVVEATSTTNDALIILGSVERNALGALAATAGGSVHAKFINARLYLGL